MSLNTICFDDIVAGEEHSFAALYGMQNDKRSHFLAKLMAYKKTRGAKCQFVLIMNPERELQFAQIPQEAKVDDAAAAESFFPFLNELQFLGIPKQMVDVRRMDFRKWMIDQEAYQQALNADSSSLSADSDAIPELPSAPSMFTSSSPIVLIFDDTHGISKLSDYIHVLSPMIQSNANSGNETFDSTFLVFDDVRAIANLDNAATEDIDLLLTNWIRPRRELKLSVMMAPEIQFCEQVFPSIRKELDYLLFADKPLTYEGLKMWQRMHFLPFGYGSEDQELINAFHDFEKLRRQEVEPVFRAFIIHRFRQMSSDYCDSTIPVDKLTFLELVDFILYKQV